MQFVIRDGLIEGVAVISIVGIVVAKPGCIVLNGCSIHEGKTLGWAGRLVTAGVICVEEGCRPNQGIGAYKKIM